MSTPNGTGAPPPAIVTSAELAQRTQQRPEPAPAMHHTPGGHQQAAASQQSFTANEARIDHLQSRLDQVRNGFETSQVFASLNGRAKADFGRSR